MSTPQSPRLAATMILLREHAGTIEVLMTRRHANLAFMGGMWVFPGGTLAPADKSEAARALVVDADRQTFPLKDLEGGPLAQPLSLALAIAACRETFEETGVLVAKRSNDAPIATPQLLRLQSERAKLAADPEQFVAALARESLRFDLDRVIYWAHWITPSAVAKRFDTHFFAAQAPNHHEFAADTHEATECVWMSPRELLDRAARGEMKIAQPTRYNLEELVVSLERHGSLDRFLLGEANRDVASIMPKMLETEIVMPWDPAFDSVAGEAVRGTQKYSPTLLALPSRAERDH